MVDYKIKYDNAQKLLKELIDKDYNFISDVKQLGVPEVDLIDIFNEIHKYNFEINQTERKVILNNLINAIYVMSQYNELAYNKDLSYSEREENNYNAILSEVRVRMFMTYLEEGKSLKFEFESFKKDFSDYATNLKIIGNVVDEKLQGIELCIEERINDSNKILSKYQDRFSISKSMLRSMYEKDFIVI